jgi:ABC-2 type transport system ATP-binding protein
MSSISLHRVTKTFRVAIKAGRIRRTWVERHAVRDLTLDIAAGSVTGFIGPNGAGKSTTIKMLTGILVPTGGQVRVDGMDPSRARIDVTRRIGVVFGQRSQLWWDLPLIESFHLLRHLYRVDRARHRANVDRYVDLLDMGSFVTTPVRQLSLGQRMRGELTAALLHDPGILFLDEPTIGLDVVSKEAVRRFLAELNREAGTTVLLTTHDLSDVERLCDRLVIIDGGRVIEDSTVDAIRTRYGVDRMVVVDLEEPRPALRLRSSAVVREEGPRQWVRFSRHRTTAAAVVAEILDAAPVRDLTVEEPDIDDIVRRIYTADRTPTAGRRADAGGSPPAG